MHIKIIISRAPPHWPCSVCLLFITSGLCKQILAPGSAKEWFLTGMWYWMRQKSEVIVVFEVCQSWGLCNIHQKQNSLKKKNEKKACVNPDFFVAPVPTAACFNGHSSCSDVAPLLCVCSVCFCASVGCVCVCRFMPAVAFAQLTQIWWISTVLRLKCASERVLHVGQSIPWSIGGGAFVLHMLVLRLLTHRLKVCQCDCQKLKTKRATLRAETVWEPQASAAKDYLGNQFMRKPFLQLWVNCSTVKSKGKLYACQNLYHMKLKWHCCRAGRYG